MIKPVEDTLREALEYRDGKLFWRDTWPCDTQGQEAGYLCGSQKSGYRYRRLYHRGRLYMVHRVVWVLHHGAWPEAEIDHINGDSLDNRIENLRAVTKKQNMYNRPRYKNSTTGLKGVYLVKSGRHKGAFRVRIAKDGKSYSVGYFRCMMKAAKAYDRKARELHGEHARVNFPALLK